MSGPTDREWFDAAGLVRRVDGFHDRTEAEDYITWHADRWPGEVRTRDGRREVKLPAESFTIRTTAYGTIARRPRNLPPGMHTRDGGRIELP